MRRWFRSDLAANLDQGSDAAWMFGAGYTGGIVLTAIYALIRSRGDFDFMWLCIVIAALCGVITITVSVLFVVWLKRNGIAGPAAVLACLIGLIAGGEIAGHAWSAFGLLIQISALLLAFQILPTWVALKLRKRLISETP